MKHIAEQFEFNPEHYSYVSTGDAGIKKAAESLVDKYIRSKAGEIENMTTPKNITNLNPNEVFVFGSNYAGRHGKGAALTALRKFGARNGQGTGLMGQSYGIATKGWKLDVLPLPEIGTQIDRFIQFARSRPELKFFVTEIGCGLAGYHPNQIASLFGTNIPENVILPESFLNNETN